jgi:hypothetical protein
MLCVFAALGGLSWWAKDSPVAHTSIQESAPALVYAPKTAEDHQAPRDLASLHSRDQSHDQSTDHSVEPLLIEPLEPESKP